MNADPEVMRHFTAPYAREQSDGFARRSADAIEQQGWGRWAVEVVGGAPFVGFVGLAPVRFEAHFTPAVEVGWRLAREQWGCGYATEAARGAVDFGFDELGLHEIVSFTAVGNEPSRRVMERLGMRYDGEFAHPLLGEDDPTREHVLYRLQRDDWSRLDGRRA